jgi:hypothetical protein
MLAASLGIAVASLAVAALWALLRSASRRGRDAATPAAVAAACAAGAMLQATDPYFAILRAGRPIPPSVQLWGLGVATGAAVALAAVVSGARLVHARLLGHTGEPALNDDPPEPPLAWIAAGVLLGLLALAGSAALLDAQLLFLAGATIIWMRSGSGPHPGPLLTAAVLGLAAGWGAGIASGITSEAPTPFALALAAGMLTLAIAAALASGASGRGGLAAFLTITLGFGLPSISHAFVMLALQSHSIRTSTLGTGLWIAGELTSGQPYRWGLSSLWPEVAVAGVVAACLGVAGRGHTAPAARQLAGAACIAAGCILLAFRLVRAVHG